MKFPKKLFVKIGGHGGGKYFDPHININSMVDASERKRIAIYKLDDIVEARGSVTVVTAKSTRKSARHL